MDSNASIWGNPNHISGVCRKIQHSERKGQHRGNYTEDNCIVPIELNLSWNKISMTRETQSHPIIRRPFSMRINPLWNLKFKDNLNHVLSQVNNWLVLKNTSHIIELYQMISSLLVLTIMKWFLFINYCLLFLDGIFLGFGNDRPCKMSSSPIGCFSFSTWVVEIRCPYPS